MSVLGFRKLKTDVVSFGITVNVSTPSTYTSAYETNHFRVEPFVWRDFKIYGLSPVFTRQDGELTIISDCEAEGVRGLAPLNINKLIEDSPIFNITSYSNDDVSDWLEINTISVNTVTLKAGTYIFNNPLAIGDSEELVAEISFTSKIVDAENNVDINISCTVMSIVGRNAEGNVFRLPVVVYGGITSDVVIPDDYVSDGATLPYIDEFAFESFRSVTFATDQTVDDAFGNWFITNTNYNEVNAKPLAEITYNGQVIASLNAGETCTLKCAGLPMETDIIVKVNG